MNRRIALVGFAALAGCTGAGVSTDYLRDEVSAELSQVLVNRSQLAQWIFSESVDPQTLDRNIDTVRARLSAISAQTFDVTELQELRRFYSTPDGQAVAALAYAEEGNRPKAELSGDQYTRLEASLAKPLIARSVSVLRSVLKDAFTAEFAFGG